MMEGCYCSDRWEILNNSLMTVICADDWKKTLLPKKTWEVVKVSSIFLFKAAAEAALRVDPSLYAVLLMLFTLKFFHIPLDTRQSKAVHLITSTTVSFQTESTDSLWNIASLSLSLFSTGIISASRLGNWVLLCPPPFSSGLVTQRPTGQHVSHT